MAGPDSPFTEALHAFDPTAQPYAGMDPPQLIEMERRRIADDDLRRCWTVRFHFLNRLPPYRRYVHLVQYTVRTYLLMAEDRGGLPRGWAAGRGGVPDRGRPRARRPDDGRDGGAGRPGRRADPHWQIHPRRV